MVFEGIEIGPDRSHRSLGRDARLQVRQDLRNGDFPLGHHLARDECNQWKGQEDGPHPAAAPD